MLYILSTLSMFSLQLSSQVVSELRGLGPTTRDTVYSADMERECNSYMKIFRPWASSGAEEQDATISTTTSNHEDDVKKAVVDVKEKTTQIERIEYLKEVVSPVPTASSADWYGLTPADALLLEAASLAHGLGHGHAAEEYARVLLGEEQRARLTAVQRKQRPKKYKCPHCDVGFSNNGQLKGHIRIHTGERPFRCDVASCGKTFTRNEELTRHKRIHSGLRPFPCTECGKRFGRKDHLKKHARTHAQQRAAALYSAVPLLPVLLPPPVGFDPWTFLPVPPHIPTHTLYGY